MEISSDLKQNKTTRPGQAMFVSISIEDLYTIETK